MKNAFLAKLGKTAAAPAPGTDPLDAPAETSAPGDPAFAAALVGLDEEAQYTLEERAAVAEFDGGLSRAAAERQALADPWAAAFAHKQQPAVEPTAPASDLPAVEDFHQRMAAARMQRRVAELKEGGGIEMNLNDVDWREHREVIRWIPAEVYERFQFSKRDRDYLRALADEFDRRTAWACADSDWYFTIWREKALHVERRYLRRHLEMFEATLSDLIAKHLRLGSANECAAAE